MLEVFDCNCIIFRETPTEIKILLEFNIKKNVQNHIINIVKNIIDLAEENIGVLLPYCEKDKNLLKEGKIYLSFKILFTWEDDVDDFIEFISRNKLGLFERNYDTKNIEDVEDEYDIYEEDNQKSVETESVDVIKFRQELGGTKISCIIRSQI